MGSFTSAQAIHGRVHVNDYNGNTVTPCFKIYRDPHAPLTKTMPDGSTRPCLCTMMKVPTSQSWASMMPMPFSDGPPPSAPPMQTETVILVHPDRWDAFYMAISQPDVFAHPEVRALLLGQPGTAVDKLRAAAEEA